MKKQEFESVLRQGGRLPDLAPIEGYLHDLASEQRLPELALAMCAARFEEAGPPLRAMLARAADGETLSEEEAMLLFRGLHVLGGARDRQAWPLLRRLLQRPIEEIDPLLGDTVTISLARIVAGVFDGDEEGLFGEIADRSLDEFIREALFGAATFLAWEGQIDRGAMRRFLERFHQERLAEDEDVVWVAWLEAIAMLGLRELRPLVESAWREGLIPEEVLEFRHFEEDLASAERAPDDIDRFKSANLGYIDDVIESLDWSRDTSSAAEARDRPRPPRDFADTILRSTAPVVNPWRHVGRNDPCPCGSGKKAKKCCLVH